MPLKDAAYREKIILYLGRNLSSNITGNKIATDLGLFYSLVHKTVKDLERDGLLKIERIGNYKLLKLSLGNHRTVLELALLSHKLKEETEKEGKIKENINDFISKISKEKDLLSVILTENSIFAVAGRANMHIEIAAKTADLGREISVIRHDDFANMLSDAGFSKELLNGIVLHGYENFWRMIAESMP